MTASKPSRPFSSTSPFAARWAMMSARERKAVALAGTLVGMALLWNIAIAPAWRTLQTAPARHAVLDVQWQHLSTLQSQARQWKESVRPSAGVTQQQLRALTERTLGTTATIQITGDQATIRLQQTTAEALAQWLTQLRSATQVRPLGMQLQRSSAPVAATQVAPTSRSLARPTPAPIISAASITHVAPGGIAPGPSGIRHIPNASSAHASVSAVPPPNVVIPSSATLPASIATGSVFWSGHITLGLPNR